ncbi:MAG: phycobilisome rod-core linker polypeptide [Nostoc sp. SerVER01]|uniref:phycobilisome rod-core linker polypeptide n=1 Tax=Nostoc sp. CCY 9925 TaxID=3103865 RepID=UPI002AD79E27|nr:phycobilisome linker polypeptide [Nostoc sp. SerVER01]MDZ8024569.1 phycobilisome linker polypeptide [Nostoc sp. DedQUE11]MDZ8074873.1 phycobilisome linker polypeptide [Nostoc sp. DedQUE01]MDZ8080603.1 phycobilisome linker polypeptide [Nostoc sp. DcaGUA01]MDZ8238294.1 phycobilisome linker polypeptide [Nostoc sp. ChiQUE01a]
MAALGQAARLGIEPFENSGIVELRPDRTEADVAVVIRAAYRQILGNAYLLEGERLESAESLLQQGTISVRGFVSAIAQSELYREKFFYSNSQTRFIELNYKHLLGRAPEDESEISYHVELYNSQGYEAEINSYIDSSEYQENFGENVVPYYRGFKSQVGKKNVGYGRLFQLYRGYANSDRAQGQKQGKLTWEIAKNLASPIYPVSSGALTGLSTGSRGEAYRIRVLQAASPNSAVVRRGTAELIVSYEQLSSKLQQLNRKGSKVISITAV